jgi:hypothetical protein
MERKFTEGEIVKALECCIRGNMCRSNCPYDDKFDTCEECTSRLAKDALDIINRQKAEIADERARKELCAEVIKRLDKESETARAEAIKEFAERLQAKAMLQHGGVTVVYGSDIDNLVKEMTGENNGN